MYLKAKTQAAFDALCALPVSFPCGGWVVEVDPDTCWMLTEAGFSLNDFEYEGAPAGPSEVQPTTDRGVLEQ